MYIKMRASAIILISAVGLALSAEAVRAEVKLPPLLGSHMVLQRDLAQAKRTFLSR